MKKVKVLKLGTRCRDKATCLEGVVTHWAMNMSGDVQYVFQPGRLNDKGQPLDQLYLCGARLEVVDSDYEMIDVPFEILGTTVTDTITTFTGIAVNFIRHLSGCFHVTIQPSSVEIDALDFDLRRCEGEMIRPLPEKEAEKSKKEEPSPSPVKAGKFPL